MATTTWRALGKCRLLMNAAKATPSATAKAAPSATAKAKAAPSAAAKTPGKGINKSMPISPILKDFLGGTPESSRPEAVKKIWEYIKLHNLQNPSDKRQIMCDKKLKTLFSGKDTVGMLEIAGLLSQHFVKTG